MPISPLQFLQMQERTQAATRNKLRQPAQAAEREVGRGGLREQIEAWCAAQWPKWKVLGARTDQRSTLPVGAHDMTIYASGGRIFHVELKAKGCKPTPEQRVWAKELEMLGHRVHVIYSLEEFLDLQVNQFK